jgi:hypothetical protein
MAAAIFRACAPTIDLVGAVGVSGRAGGGGGGGYSTAIRSSVTSSNATVWPA